jgi:hypothetical protein
MFCFVDDNTIIYIHVVIANSIIDQDGFSKIFWLSWVVDQVKTFKLPVHYIRLGCLPRRYFNLFLMF